jgi:hypothetical protein
LLGIATVFEGDLIDAIALADARMYADKRAHKSNEREQVH